MATKERLHRLVEELREEDVPAAETALERVRLIRRMGGHKVAVEEDAEGWYVANVPTLSVHTQARSLDELEARLREAVELCRPENPQEVDAVLRYMGPPGDPVARSLWSSPFDDEPYTEEERRLVEEAEEELRRGQKPIPLEELERELGL